MGRSRPSGLALACAAALLSGGCTPINPFASSPAISPEGTVPAVRVDAVRHDLEAAEQRVRELQNRLTEREREITAAQADVQAARAREQAAMEALEQARAQAPAPAEAGSLAPPAPPAPAGAAPAPARAAGGGAARRTLAEAEIRIATLEWRLAAETQRRQQVEAEMSRLLEETAAGPFERAPGATEARLRSDLEAARREIGELKTMLAAQRRDRAELERRYLALQAQVQTASAAAGAPSEEIEALKERQRRVLASIQQDLRASRRSEEELRTALAAAQGTDAPSLADAVAGLRAENSALQLRLDEEHRHNRDLSAKLQLATRVTDLIFRMQTGNVAPSAPAPVERLQ